MVSQASNVRRLYDDENARLGRNPWGIGEYLQGFIADVGALSKLIMARNGFRDADNVDDRIAHELADCLWSIIVLANELDVDLETAFEKTMTQLEARLI
jgi:NTP pyrophosphatase (non-canonical NTP hydrolase)